MRRGLLLALALSLLLLPVATGGGVAAQANPGAGASKYQGKYDLGNHPVGEKTSVQLQYTVTGSGSGSGSGVYYSSFTIGGTNASDFGVRNDTCPTSPPGLGNGGTCLFTVSFTPSARGARQATVTIGCTLGTCPDTLDLVGYGTVPCGQLFGDVKANDPACEAIEALADRGVIRGCDPSASPPLFCPTNPTRRHEMAALIVRAIPAWASETGLPTFTDNTTDAELMTRVATLQRHNVVRGYQDEVCTGQGKTPPCYGPLDNVTYGQSLLFIARALVASGKWTLRPDDRGIFPDQNGAAGADPNTDQQTLDHRAIVTYVFYLGSVPDVANVRANFAVATADGTKGWADATPRAWFARALWNALVPRS